MKRRLLFGIILIALLLTGCTDPFAEYRTDREYYRTHTGTTEEKLNQIVSDEKLTPNDKMTSVEDGVITECDLRTGIETQGYEDAARTTEAVLIKADQVLSIEEEAEGSFRVSYDGRDVWIAQTQCMINAKQYIPSLEVELVLGKNFNNINFGDTKITGLTDHQFYDRTGSTDNSEVWLRYETAVKLLEAQKTFWNDGYCIKLYDAYRPDEVTVSMREKYSDFLKSGVGSELKNAYFKNGYGESSFIEQTISPHSYGVAVDVSIIEQDTERDILMPSSIYSLDYRSGKETWFATGKTEDNNAQYLESVMKSKGFTPSDSKWWHFQDDTLNRVMFEVSN